MAPGSRDVQLTSLAGAGDDYGEEVRLLDSFDSRVGIDGGMRRIQVRVTGMTCAACSTSVESALGAVDGVITASVALLQNKADVVFNPALVKVYSLSLSLSLSLCSSIIFYLTLFLECLINCVPILLMF